MTFTRRARFALDLALLLLLLLSARLLDWSLLRGPRLLALYDPALHGPLNALPRSLPDLKTWLESGGDLADLPEAPAPLVQRWADLIAGIERGAIYDRTGAPLVENRRAADGSLGLSYPQPAAAPVIGQISGLGLGVSGLQAHFDRQLLGLDRLQLGYKRVSGAPPVGDHLVLTLDAPLQAAAEQALAGRRGAIVILDGRSGAVLAEATWPHPDYNRLQEPGYLAELTANCPAPDCDGLLLNRAVQGRYPPGSTWKTVTLIAALDRGGLRPDAVFDFGQPVRGPNGSYFVYRVDGGEIPDPNHRESRLSLDLAYAKSANAAFARISDELDPQLMLSYAARFGVGAPLIDPAAYDLEMDLTPGQLTRDPAIYAQNNLLQAATGIGQGEILVSPFHMALVPLAVLNGGSLPLPYLVEAVLNPNGQVMRRHAPSLQPGLFQAATAEQVRAMMITAVTRGSGTRAAIPGVTVGGKTGTAQVGGSARPHAWFTGFAERDGAAVVLSILVEDAGEGSQVAAPLFAQLAPLALDALRAAPEAAPPLPTALPQPAPLTPTPADLTGGAPTPSPVPAGDTLPADLPFKPGMVDFTTLGAAACPGQHDPVVGSGEFAWPSQYQALSGGDFKEGHPGIDLNAPTGSAVYAADHGLVIFAGWTGVGYGNVIVIDHGNGYRTLYAHLSQVSEHCGAAVQRGEVIGAAGETGNVTGPHLHFEVRVPGGYVYPLKVLPTP